MKKIRIDMENDNEIKYSFIIPVKEINDYIRESIPKILEISRNDYEIIVYPDYVNSESWGKTFQIGSGPGGPAMKRSLASRDAKGEFLVFIDDDAYPEKDILDKLDDDFSDEKVAAVGGPAMTPESDTFLQKISGAVFLSSLSGGFPERYVPVGKKRFISDWPTVNLTVRKKIFQKIGGFDCSYWPGEDTKFCLDIIRKIPEKNKILYDPDVLVWHHRREGFLRHLKQIGGYGTHRGFFAKKYPETSFRINYFIPSAFLLFVVFGMVLSFFFPIILRIYIIGWIIYLLALTKVFIDIVHYQKNIKVAFCAIGYVFFTHLIYGLMFIKGFLKKDLKSKLR